MKAISNGKHSYGYKIEDRLVSHIHLVQWDLESETFNLSDDLRLCKFQGTKVEKLYEDLMEKEILTDAEPSEYDIFIEIDNPFKRKYKAFYIGAFEKFDLVCALLGITFGGYIDLGDILYISAERDKVYRIIPIIYTETRPQIDCLVEKIPRGFKIDFEMAKYLREAWKAIWKGVKEGKFNRLFNAVRFYYLASTAIRESESILHLVIILETLFSLHSHSEVAHQVSLNASKFLRDNVEDRKELYKTLKKIYAERSKIVHGGIPRDENKFFQYVDKAFNITAESLFKILSSSELITIFLNEKLRLKYIEDLNFQ